MTVEIPSGKPSPPHARQGLSMVMLACAVGMFVSGGPIIQQTFGVFLGPMERELGWSRGELSLLPALAAWSCAVITPIVGHAIDRWEVRPLLPIGFVFFAAINLLIGFAEGDRIQLYALYILLGVASAPVGVLCYATLVSKTFLRSRGIILGLSVGGGAGLGSALVPQIVRLVLTASDWRTARISLGVLVLIGGALVVLLLQPRVRVASSEADEPECSPMVGPEFSEVIRSPLLWMIVAASSLTNTSLSGIGAHMVPLMMDRTPNLAEATWVLSVFGMTHLVGQLVAGLLLDRVDRPQIALLFFGTGLIGLLMMHIGGDYGVYLAAAALLGWGHGAEMSAGAYFLARYFGVRAYGAAFGLIVLFGSLGAGLGPVLLGTIFDVNGSYQSALVVLELFVGASVLVVAFLPRYALQGSAPKLRHQSDPSVQLGTADPLRNKIKSAPW